MSYPNAAKGLRLMFIAQIVLIVGVLLAWVPVVGFLLVVASPVLDLVGLYTAGNDDENYRGALFFAVAILVVDLVQGFFSPGILTSLLSAANSILNLLLVYSVCNTTANLLHSLGQEALSQRGATIIKIFALCTAVSLVCRVLSIVPIINILAWVVSLLSDIVQLVGSVMYLLFLNSSSKAL